MKTASEANVIKCSYHKKTITLALTVSITLLLFQSGYARSEVVQPLQATTQIQTLDELEHWRKRWQQQAKAILHAQGSQQSQLLTTQFNEELHGKLPSIEANRTKDSLGFIQLVNSLNAFLNAYKVRLNERNQVQWTYLNAQKETQANNIPQALILHKRLVQNNDPLVRARANYNILNIAIITEDYALAIEQQKHIRENLANLPTGQVKSISKLMLAYFYNFVGEYTLASQTLENISIANLSPRDRCIFRLHQFNSEKNHAGLKTIETIFNQSKLDCLSIGEALLFNAILFNVIEYYLEHDEHQKVGALFDKYAQLMANDHYHYAETLRVTLNYQLTVNRLEQAKITVPKLMAELARLEDTGRSSRYIAESYKLLAQYFFQHQDYQQASDFLHQYQRHQEYTSNERLAKAQAREQMHQARMLDEQSRLQLKQNLLTSNENQQTVQQVFQQSLHHQIAIQFSLLALAIVILVLYVFMRRHLLIITPLKKRLQLDAASGALTRQALENICEQCLPTWYKAKVPVSALIIQLPMAKYPASSDANSLPSNSINTHIQKPGIQEHGQDQRADMDRTLHANISKQRLWEYQQQLLEQQTVATISSLGNSELGVKQINRCNKNSSACAKLKMVYHALFNDHDDQPKHQSMMIARASQRQFIVLYNQVDKEHSMIFAAQLQKKLTAKLGIDNIRIGVTHSENSGYRFRYIMMDLIAALQATTNDSALGNSENNLNHASNGELGSLSTELASGKNKNAMVAYCPLTIIESPSYQDNQSSTLFKQAQRDTNVTYRDNDAQSDKAQSYQKVSGEAVDV
ncbi:hypothetical protein FE810_04710 [Thalassotalea litorea]|uniref:GGDEF domain-containing protein n=2 Tax=Thalassotalea litorea TaxID=2020715 RepID=A0A5R9ING1_9GAMM|nr:hypothetical protein FE810_04710 [Thalassotalea litorea]